MHNTVTQGGQKLQMMA